MEDEKYNLLISIASLWEIVIKSSLGKLLLKRDVPEIINGISKSGFSILHIKPQHLIALHKLEYYHKDPFDRVIISQAITENIPIVTSDENFDEYKVVLIRGKG
jgi:PIN domain nuclease of toxin-antitoxin system